MRLLRLSAVLPVCALAVWFYLPAAAQSGGGNIGDPRMDVLGRDPGCVAPMLVSAGGPAPKDPQTLAIRWIGYSNFELAYNGQIFLLDAYYDRGPGFVPLGVKSADIKKANVILVGHGHSDHMSDAASIGARTGAMVIGGVVGGIAGYVGGSLDDGLMRAADFVMVLPAMYVALALRSVLPLVLTPAVVFTLLTSIFAVVGAPFVARGVRAIVRSERRLDYAAAAQALGASDARLLLRHLLPATRGFLAPVLPVPVLRGARHLDAARPVPLRQRRRHGGRRPGPQRGSGLRRGVTAATWPIDDGVPAGNGGDPEVQDDQRDAAGDFRSRDPQRIGPD